MFLRYFPVLGSVALAQDRNGREPRKVSGDKGVEPHHDTLFSDDAVTLVHQTSRGYPRAVNNLAVQALVAAFAADKAIVDESSTRTAIAEVLSARLRDQFVCRSRT